MKIYWSQKSIPALVGLSLRERDAAKKSVIFKVWSHWQVWIPIVAQIGAFVIFVILTPHLPYRLPLTLVFIYITTMLASLPFNHYLSHYLNQANKKF